MSTDYHAVLAYGFRVYLEDVETTAVKYDPDTGEAYNKEVYSHTNIRCLDECDNKIVGVLSDPKKIHDNNVWEGMTVVSEDSYKGYFVVGVLLQMCDIYNQIKQVNPPDVEFDKEVLEIFGVPPQMILTLSIS